MNYYGLNWSVFKKKKRPTEIIDTIRKKFFTLHSMSRLNMMLRYFLSLHFTTIMQVRMVEGSCIYAES